MKSIITISRCLGSGGSEIGRAVANRLHYYYCDRDMIIKAATETTSIPPEVFRRYDERVPHEFGIGQSLFNYHNKPLYEKLFDAQQEAVIKVASAGKCVIIGRNANAILQEFDRTLHVFVTATEYFRVKRLQKEHPDQTEEQILAMMRNVDSAREKYCTYYTNTQFGNAMYYDLCLKSSTLGIQGCVDLICELAQREDS